MHKTLFAVTDVETTGLNADTNYLLEAGIILVDEDLNEISRFVGHIRVRDEDRQMLYNMADDYVKDMHEKSGLWDAIGGNNPRDDIDDSLFKLDTNISNWLNSQLSIQPEGTEVRTMGNSLRLDLNFIEEDLPQLYSILGHRSVDMTAVEKFMVHFLPGYTQYEKPEEPEHRSIGDDEQCLEQARSVAQHLAMLATEIDEKAARIVDLEQEVADLKHTISEMGH